MSAGPQTSRQIIQQSHTWAGNFAPSRELVPPLASEGFGVYGNAGVQEQVRTWALVNHYLLARGVPDCAHGIYLMHECPAYGEGGCGFRAGFDHTSLWVDYDRPYEPFILTHPYHGGAVEKLRGYATAHGLDFRQDDLTDGWYNEHATPVRLTSSISWPLGLQAQIIVTTFPVTWPELDDLEASWIAGAGE